MDFKFKEARLEVFSYATEDKEKVLIAVKNLIPELQYPNLTSEEVILQGHFHNQIIKLNLKIIGDENIKQILNFIFGNISENEKNTLIKNLDYLIDDSAILYLRLNKQYAYDKKISLNMETGNVIKIAFTILKKGPYNIELVKKFYKNLISGKQNIE